MINIIIKSEMGRKNKNKKNQSSSDVTKASPVEETPEVVE